ncbi:MAG: MetQ/NlpA family ABC transporter substrate-binding protein [Lachnospiraceae bacterium]|nr:MetQ/NlpA family ABC transporter substrate-binding protein [Lachnospiraceae bacterium]
MKKKIVFVLAALTALGMTVTAFAEDDTTIVVGASPAPHAEILAAAEDVLAEQGYTLKIQEYSDYIQPNMALAAGDLDANYFQHQLYLDNYNAENGTEIATAAAIHYEPFGIYAGKTASLEELEDGAVIAVPNDPSNEARALLLLEAQGLIKLKEDAGLEATTKDIEENTKNLEIMEIEAAQLPRSLQDVDMAVINGNYAIDAGLSVAKDAVAIEEGDSDVIQSYYANVIAVNPADKDSDKIKALVAALKSDTVKTFIEDTYDGAVVPLF